MNTPCAPTGARVLCGELRWVQPDTDLGFADLRRAGLRGTAPRYVRRGGPRARVHSLRSMGSREYLACESGRVKLTTPSDSWVLGPGDVVFYRGDQPHGYTNPDDAPGVAYTVVVPPSASDCRGSRRPGSTRARRGSARPPAGRSAGGTPRARGRRARSAPARPPRTPRSPCTPPPPPGTGRGPRSRSASTPPRARYPAARRERGSSLPCDPAAAAVTSATAPAPPSRRDR